MVQRYNLFFYYHSIPPPKKKVTDLLVSLRLYCRYIMHIGPIMHIRRSETNGSVTAQRD